MSRRRIDRSNATLPFEVADCDATTALATGRGATMMIPPMDAEGVGRLAMFTDPQGAVFAVIKSVPMT